MTMVSEEDRTLHVVTAAHPVAALAARVSHDHDFTAQLVRAAHANDARQIEQLLEGAGVTGAVAAINQQRQIISIHLDIGPIHISIEISKSNK